MWFPHHVDLIHNYYDPFLASNTYQQVLANITGDFLITCGARNIANQGGYVFRCFFFSLNVGKPFFSCSIYSLGSNCLNCSNCSNFSNFSNSDFAKKVYQM